MLTMVGDCFDNRIGEGFPALSLMASRLIGTHGKGCIQQQHPLSCPAGEVSTFGIR